jgi:hypothetical protein
MCRIHRGHLPHIYALYLGETSLVRVQVHSKHGQSQLKFRGLANSDPAIYGEREFMPHNGYYLPDLASQKSPNLSK